MAIERATDPVARLERELLGRLGLGPDASAEDVTNAHGAIVSYLASAPKGARGWARAQAAAADEAVTLLSDPAALARRAGSAPPPPLEKAPAKPARPARIRATAPEATPAATADADEVLDELIAEVTPSAHRDEVRAPQPRRMGRGGTRPVVTRSRLAIAAAVAGVAVVALVVSGFAGSSVPAAPGPAASQAAAGIDEAAVAALMQRIQEDPNDTEALMSLGDAFFAAGQYDVAAEWLTRLVALDPDDTRALLALGAAQFNAGDAAGAEANWTRVVELDPENVEGHYDLGFLYLQREPPDLAAMQREWQTVVELAPGTEVASSVQAHLDALASPASSAEASDPGQ